MSRYDVAVGTSSPGLDRGVGMDWLLALETVFEELPPRRRHGVGIPQVVLVERLREARIDGLEDILEHARRRWPVGVTC
jgi:hypothetical protein